MVLFGSQGVRLVAFWQAASNANLEEYERRRGGEKLK